MPVDPAAAIEITAFDWVPQFAQGRVRDLRVRWALEEAGQTYRVRTLPASGERPLDYYHEQPWGQVPSYIDDQVELFETGAIVLHIGRRFGGVLPLDEPGRARATAWVIAALNSVEPFVGQLPTIDLFHRGEAWTVERRPQVVQFVTGRLERLSQWLGDKDWLEGEFSAGDLIMIDVLRIADGSGVLDQPNLRAYLERGTARPAFVRALDAQIAGFTAPQAQGA